MADFQQFYGIALPEGGEPADLPRLAALWSQLPRESRTVRREAPDREWGTSDYLLWLVEFHLRALRWMLSDEKSRGPEPRPLPDPARRAEAMRRRDSAMASRDEIDEAFGMGE